MRKTLNVALAVLLAVAPAAAQSPPSKGNPNFGSVTLDTPLAPSSGGTGAAQAQVGRVLAGPAGAPGTAAAPASFRPVATTDLPEGAQSGCVRLTYLGPTQVQVAPRNCQTQFINGQAVLQTSQQLGNSGLSNSSVYYVYEGASGTGTQASLNATGHVTGTDGREYLNAGGGVPNYGQLLVGAVLTNASGQFAESATFHGVANWFGRRSVALTQLTGNVSVGGGTTLIAGPITAFTWADEPVEGRYYGTTQISAAGAYLQHQMLVDGGNGAAMYASAPAASGYAPVVGGYEGPNLGEGAHSFSVTGNESNAANTTTSISTRLLVSLRG